MRILAADIGGTSSRFAEVEINNLDSLEILRANTLDTSQNSIRSFDDLLNQYFALGHSKLADFDVVCFAVAGTVKGKTAILPNISWDIDLRGRNELNELLLLNDFEAQAHAFALRQTWESLLEIRRASDVEPRSVAIVGAGTGLGHCLLIKPQSSAGYECSYFALASEHGHVNFPFVGSEERELEQFALEKLNLPFITYDDVVSGGGISLIHHFLTGNVESPAKALANVEDNHRTIKMFSRFFARACRNYCLTTRSFDALIISGGIAAKNPHVIESESFTEEFCTSQDYMSHLQQVSIFLNTDELVGMKGATVFGFREYLGSE